MDFFLIDVLLQQSSIAVVVAATEEYLAAVVVIEVEFERFFLLSVVARIAAGWGTCH